MSTVHYIVRIDNKNETYDTSLIMKTELENEIDTKIKELQHTPDTYFLHITKTDDNYNGYIIDNTRLVSEIADAVIEPDVSDATDEEKV